MKCQVLISGGGIAGLTLALKLVKKNIDVIVLEKDSQASMKYKGELLQPKSLELLSRLHVYETVEQHGFPIYETSILEKGVFNNNYKVSFNYGVLYHPFNFAMMVPHEKLKSILLKEAKKYPSFTYLKPAKFISLSRDKKIKEYATIKLRDRDEELKIYADTFIGAEGRYSPLRRELAIPVIETSYNHYFLTVSFPRPQTLTSAEMVIDGYRFLGLFPLPNQQVRTVLLIKPEEFKQLKKTSIEVIYEMYTQIYPDLDGYVQFIKSWKEIQLMIPLRHNAVTYVSGNCVLMGDAAHTVHPMAGEGMNLAIQDADCLGELLGWMFDKGTFNYMDLKWFEKIRKPRAEFLSKLSHQSAFVYSHSFNLWRKFRGNVLNRMEHSHRLHFKHMLNISGLGIWKENLVDRLLQVGLLSENLLGSWQQQDYFFYQTRRISLV
ncbi:MAG: FAD-dependent monooxygenase [Bacillus sp. (in: Bacteria)]|nr:FAD-dependent monooxygenase [Bacillus sp. (in: firmicutes)]